MTKNGAHFTATTFPAAEPFKITVHANQRTWTPQGGHKMWKTWANTKSKGLKFCRVHLLPELHTVIVVMMSP